jgi:hypothetical protein
MARRIPIVTLLTDFGTDDTYVGQMKGVILARCPSARVIDLTHAVRPQAVIQGAFLLETALDVFPSGTVHVAVVDPGVGTSRRGLAVTAAGQLFVGPDNGLFTPALSRPGWEAFELRAAEYRLPTVSVTFHGRDVFGPAAAHLALGVAPTRLGPPARDPVRLGWPTAHAVGDDLVGEVVHVDRFGNLLTSIGVDALEQTAARHGGAVTVRIAGRPIPLVRTYGDLAPGSAGALVGSAGRLEVAVREGSAAARLRAGRGTLVRLSRSTKSWRASGRRRS